MIASAIMGTFSRFSLPGARVSRTPTNAGQGAAIPSQLGPCWLTYNARRYSLEAP